MQEIVLYTHLCTFSGTGYNVYNAICHTLTLVHSVGQDIVLQSCVTYSLLYKISGTGYSA